MTPTFQQHAWQSWPLFSAARSRQKKNVLRRPISNCRPSQISVRGICEKPKTSWRWRVWVIHQSSHTRNEEQTTSDTESFLVSLVIAEWRRNWEWYAYFHGLIPENWALNGKDWNYCATRSFLVHAGPSKAMTNTVGMPPESSYFLPL